MKEELHELLEKRNKIVKDIQKFISYWKDGDLKKLTDELVAIDGEINRRLRALDKIYKMSPVMITSGRFEKKTFDDFLEEIENSSDEILQKR